MGKGCSYGNSHTSRFSHVAAAGFTTVSAGHFAVHVREHQPAGQIFGWRLQVNLEALVRMRIRSTGHHPSAENQQGGDEYFKHVNISMLTVIGFPYDFGFCPRFGQLFGDILPVSQICKPIFKGAFFLCELPPPPRLRVLPPWFAIAYAAPLELVIIVGRFLQSWRFHGAGAGPFVVQLRRY